MFRFHFETPRVFGGIAPDLVCLARTCSRARARVSLSNEFGGVSPKENEYLKKKKRIISKSYEKANSRGKKNEWTCKPIEQTIKKEKVFLNLEKKERIVFSSVLFLTLSTLLMYVCVCVCVFEREPNKTTKNNKMSFYDQLLYI